MPTTRTRKRTTLLIREDQLAEVIRITGAKSASEAVDAALAAAIEAEKVRRHIEAYQLQPSDMDDDWGPPLDTWAPDWSDFPWDGPDFDESSEAGQKG